MNFGAKLHIIPALQWNTAADRINISCKIFHWCTLKCTLQIEYLRPQSLIDTMITQKLFFSFLLGLHILTKFLQIHLTADNKFIKILTGQRLLGHLHNYKFNKKIHIITPTPVTHSKK